MNVCIYKTIFKIGRAHMTVLWTCNLCLGITSGRDFSILTAVLGIDSGLSTCKASALLIVLSLSPTKAF